MGIKNVLNNVDEKYSQSGGASNNMMKSDNNENLETIGNTSPQDESSLSESNKIKIKEELQKEITQCKEKLEKERLAREKAEFALDKEKFTTEKLMKEKKDLMKANFDSIQDLQKRLDEEQLAYWKDNEDHAKILQDNSKKLQEQMKKSQESYSKNILMKENFYEENISLLKLEQTKLDAERDETIKALRNGITNLKTKNDETCKELANANSLLKEKQINNSTSQSVLKVCQDKVVELEQKNKDLENENEELKSKTENQELNQMIDDLKKKHEETKSTNKDLKEKIAIKDGKIKHLEKKEEQYWSARVTNLTHRLEMKIEGNTNENIIMPSANNPTNQNDLLITQEKLVQSEEFNKSLQNLIQTKEDKIKKCEENIVELEKNHQAEVQKLKGDLKTSDAKVKFHSDEEGKLRKINTQLKEEFGSNIVSLDSCQQKLLDAQNEIKALIEDIEVLNNSSEVLRKSNTDLEKKITISLVELNQSSIANKNLKVIGKQFREKSKAKEEDLAVKKMVIEKLENAAATVRVNLNAIQLDLLNAQNENKANVTIIQGLNISLENQQKINTLVKNTLVGSREELKKSRTTIKNLKVLGKLFREKSQTKEEDLVEKKMVIEKLEKNAASLREDLNGLQQDLLNTQNKNKAMVLTIQGRNKSICNLININTELKIRFQLPSYMDKIDNIKEKHILATDTRISEEMKATAPKIHIKSTKSIPLVPAQKTDQERETEIEILRERLLRKKELLELNLKQLNLERVRQKNSEITTRESMEQYKELVKKDKVIEKLTTGVNVVTGTRQAISDLLPSKSKKRKLD